MFKKACLLLGLVLLALPLVSADEITLKVDPEKNSYVTRGTATIYVTVENPGPGEVTGVTLKGSGGDFDFSSVTADISDGGSKKLKFTVRGEIWEKTQITITATGDHETEDVVSESATVTMEPPELDLEIESPKGEMVLVDVTEGSKVDFTIQIRNSGEMRLEGVEVTLKFDASKISCSVSTKAQDIEGGRTVSYKASCNNVSNGKEVTVIAEDERGVARDSDMVIFKLTESFRITELKILSPLENAEFRLGEMGGDISVKVKNTGEKDLEGVCLDAEGTSDFTASDCADIAIGQEHTFSINVVPADYQVNVRIKVADSTKAASDDVGVRVLKIESQIPPPVNETPPEPVNDTEKPIENGTTPPSPNGTVTPVEEGDGKILGMDPLTLVVIIVAALILIFYIKKGISRAADY